MHSPGTRVRRRITFFVLGVLGVSCSREPLPETQRSPAERPAVVCGDPVPPPLLTVHNPTDPSTCLSAAKRVRGVTVAVSVARDGHATGVDRLFHVCLEMGPDGKPLPPVELTPGELSCVLDQLRSWRFAAFSTCAPQQALVGLGPRAAFTSGGELKDAAAAPRALSGGPTTGCS
jgi:hypothetical protein